METSLHILLQALELISALGFKKHALLSLVPPLFYWFLFEVDRLLVHEISIPFLPNTQP